MRIWLALIIAPLLALSDLTISFASVGFACASQSVLSIHLVHFLFLAAALACTYGAMQAWPAPDRAATESIAQTRFLVAIATASAALSAVAIAAMWLPAWMIPSCLS